MIWNIITNIISKNKKNLNLFNPLMIPRESIKKIIYNKNSIKISFRGKETNKSLNVRPVYFTQRDNITNPTKNCIHLKITTMLKHNIHFLNEFSSFFIFLISSN
jgi:hypothetical protein